MVQSKFELHPTAAPFAESLEIEHLAWQDAQGPAPPPPLAIGAADGLVHVGIDPQTGRLERAAPDTAVAAFRVVHRRLTSDLAMLALHPDILVNGLPALALTILGPKDSVGLAPGCLCYVTERVRPYVGIPTGELLGKKCPFCGIAAEEKTRVVTCQCGALYHWETEESHPDLPEADRLRCFEKVRTCLSCHRSLTINEYLTWDPSSL